jgi:hypothetical protein
LKAPGASVPGGFSIFRETSRKKFSAKQFFYYYFPFRRFFSAEKELY